MFLYTKASKHTCQRKQTSTRSVCTSVTLPTSVNSSLTVLSNLVLNYSPHLTPPAPPTKELRNVLNENALDMLEEFLERERRRRVALGVDEGVNGEGYTIREVRSFLSFSFTSTVARLPVSGATLGGRSNPDWHNHEDSAFFIIVHPPKARGMDCMSGSASGCPIAFLACLLPLIFRWSFGCVSTNSRACRPPFRSLARLSYSIFSHPTSFLYLPHQHRLPTRSRFTRSLIQF